MQTLFKKYHIKSYSHLHISPIFRIFALVFRTQLFGKKSEKRLSSNPDDLQPTLFDDLLTPEEKQKIEAKRKQEQQEITKAVSYTRKAKNNRAVLNTEGLPVEEEILLPDGINDQTLPLLKIHKRSAIFLEVVNTLIRCRLADI